MWLTLAHTEAKSARGEETPGKEAEPRDYRSDYNCSGICGWSWP